MTRPTGAAVRRVIEREVRDRPAAHVTTLDFSRVNLLDFSCADEVVAKLLLQYTADDAPAGYVTFRGLHDGHLDPIEAVLERHALALVSWHDGTAELFGAVTAEERDCWETVRGHGPIGMADVAVHLNITPAEAGARLQRLVHRRLVMVEHATYRIPEAVGAIPGGPSGGLPA